jgi:hypothetical protein
LVPDELQYKLNMHGLKTQIFQADAILLFFLIK